MLEIHAVYVDNPYWPNIDNSFKYAKIQRGI